MQDVISWLLRESEGATTLDKCVLFIVKAVYLSSRIAFRIILGKKMRDRTCIKYDLDFGTFWYKSFSVIKRTNKRLLKFKSPKYNYEFYCRNNKDDFKIMTIHESNILEHFTPKEGDIVIDVGAHIGRYTLIASKRVGPNGKVIAIEAHPGNYEMLNRNIKLNGLSNVIALNYAAYSRQTRIKLYL